MMNPYVIMVFAVTQKLATSCDVLSEKCVKVVKEQELQLQGWNAAVANSNTVLEYVTESTITAVQFYRTYSHIECMCVYI